MGFRWNTAPAGTTKAVSSLRSLTLLHLPDGFKQVLLELFHFRGHLRLWGLDDRGSLINPST